MSPVRAHHLLSLAVMLAGACGKEPARAREPAPAPPAPSTPPVSSAPPTAPSAPSATIDAGTPRPPAAAPPDDDPARYADLLAGTGGTTDRDARPGADLSAQIAAVRASGSGAIADVDVHGPRVPDGSPTTAAAARARVTVSLTVDDDTTLTDAVIRARIDSIYAAGLRRCFLRTLPEDGPARTTLAFDLTVDEVGRARAGAPTPAGELATCVRAAANAWRFPVPRDDAGTATTVTAHLTLVLARDT